MYWSMTSTLSMVRPSQALLTMRRIASTCVSSSVTPFWSVSTTDAPVSVLLSWSTKVRSSPGVMVTLASCTPTRVRRIASVLSWVEIRKAVAVWEVVDIMPAFSQ